MGIWFFTPLTFSLPFILLYFHLISEGIEKNKKQLVLAGMAIMLMLIPVHAIAVLFALPALFIYCAVNWKDASRQIWLLWLAPILLICGLCFFKFTLGITWTSLPEAIIESIQFKRGWGVMEAALYWAEGRKTAKGIVGFSNGDPRTIKLMMRFFSEICNVSCDKFRGYIHIHPHLDVIQAEKYWSEVSGIPLNQFYKTYQKPNKASLGKKDTLPFGTFEICICNSELLLKMQGWTNGVCSKLAIN